MQCSQVYSVPVVYEDLKQPFVLRETFQQLGQLDAVFSNIFQRLQHRIDKETSRLQNINSRIETCQAKVNAITARGSSSKPTTVFSTSKYPAPKVLPAIRGLYSDRSYAESPPIQQDTDDDVHYLPAEAESNITRDQSHTEVLELFTHINEFKEARKAEVNMAEEGLGRLPEYLPSVGSVLLFNSSKNPYQQYTSWDNLLGTDYEGEEETQKELAKAPKTLVEGDELPSVSGLNYDFHPSMAEHTDLSAQLPANLPLENIADYKYADSSESGSTFNSIAPSMFHDKNLPDLPQISEFAAAPARHQPHMPSLLSNPSEEPFPEIDFNSGDPNKRKVNRDSAPSNSPPPPPPPQMDEPGISDSPPPPPPPGEFDDTPPVPPPPPSSDIPEPMEPPMEEKKAPANPRTSLLDAIRNPSNLTKLRKVKEQEVEEDRAEARSTPNKPLSIADEMRQRMARRQAAISGKQDQLEQKREREQHRPTEVLKAKEVSLPPPPPQGLPTVDISDDDDEPPRRNRADSGSSFGDEGDMLAQLRNIKQKKIAGDSQPKPHNASDFESRMPGLDNYVRPRSDSLDLSEASDWSDD